MPTSAARMRDMRRRRVAAGLCAYCGRQPHLPDRNGCRPCLDVNIMRSNGHRYLKCTFDLHPDSVVPDRLTGGTKWEIMMADGRNPGDIFAGRVEDLLRPGRRYQITIRDVGPAGPEGT